MTDHDKGDPDGYSYPAYTYTDDPYGGNYPVVPPYVTGGDGGDGGNGDGDVLTSTITETFASLTETTTFTTSFPVTLTSTFTFTTAIPTTIISDETATVTSLSISTFTSVSTFTTSVLTTLSATVTSTATTSSVFTTTATPPTQSVSLTSTTSATSTISVTTSVTSLTPTVVFDILSIRRAQVPGAAATAAVARRADSSWKRQDVAVQSGFVGSDDNPNPESCTLALRVQFLNGELIANGRTISTDPGVPFINLRNAVNGSITTDFSVQNNILVWANPQFFNGTARFCQVGTDIPVALFTEATDTPADCVLIDLIVFSCE